MLTVTPIATTATAAIARLRSRLPLECSPVGGKYVLGQFDFTASVSVALAGIVAANAIARIISIVFIE